jgi:hypothetical protein
MRFSAGAAFAGAYLLRVARLVRLVALPVSLAHGVGLGVRCPQRVAQDARLSGQQFRVLVIGL